MARIWNRLPLSIRQLHGLRILKKTLHVRPYYILHVVVSVVNLNLTDLQGLTFGTDYHYLSVNHMACVSLKKHYMYVLARFNKLFKCLSFLFSLCGASIVFSPYTIA